MFVHTDIDTPTTNPVCNRASRSFSLTRHTIRTRVNQPCAAGEPERQGHLAQLPARPYAPHVRVGVGRQMKWNVPIVKDQTPGICPLSICIIFSQFQCAEEDLSRTYCYVISVCTDSNFSGTSNLCVKILFLQLNYNFRKDPTTKIHTFLLDLLNSRTRRCGWWLVLAASYKQIAGGEYANVDTRICWSSMIHGLNAEHTGRQVIWINVFQVNGLSR